jgi:receptor protein-tyrosine kinase
MSKAESLTIIEQATRRLEELQRAGVSVPWAAAGFQAEGRADLPPAGSVEPVSARGSATPEAPVVPVTPDPTQESRQVDIDLQRLGMAGYCVPGGNRTATADEFRVIKRPLLKNVSITGPAALRRANLIQVTSALPGEGKTFSAINLALSISTELDHSVLLVDADVVRPSVMERLGLPPGPGLMDVLRDPKVRLADVLLRTNVPKLSLLPSGQGNHLTTELLASAAMDALLDDLAQRYADRIVIFDAPPLLPTTESRVLASRMGQVVVVTESGRTTREQITEAYGMLSNCPVVLSILNKYAGPPRSGPYGY